MSKSVVLKSLSRTTGSPWVVVKSAAPLNAAITTDWLPLKDSNTLYVWWEVTRVAGTGDASFAVELSYDQGTTVLDFEDDTVSSGVNQGANLSVLIPAAASDKRIRRVTDKLPPNCVVRLKMAAAVTNAGASDLITVKLASTAV